MSALYPPMCVRGYYKYLLHKRAGISELAYSNKDDNIFLLINVMV